MKRMVIFFFVFFILLTFVSGECINYFDDGDDSDSFGYVDVNGVLYVDTCISSIQIKEYYCSGGSVASSTPSCGVCQEGICYSLSCSVPEACNPVFRGWCSSGVWSTSGYCTDSNLDCYLVDSTCAASTCIEGVCDYENHAYCLGNTWVSEDYCDVSHCGNDQNSLGYCFCEDSTLILESNCVDDLDDDCDGDVDCRDSDCSGLEGCQCEEEETQTCSSDEGECESGTQSCVAGSWGVCSGIEAEMELCDDLDNDCDGLIDEDCSCVPGETRDCGENIGICKAGVQVCESDATWSVCYGASYAASEIEECNGLDDDCDGKIDEGCGCVANTTQQCGSDTGICQVGIQNCVNGTWNDCEGDIEPFPEICDDDLDNDCDAQIDQDDDTCSEEIFILPSVNITENKTTLFPECIYDSDCSFGKECSRGTCVSVPTVHLPEPPPQTNYSIIKPSEQDSSSFWIYIFLAVFAALVIMGVVVWMVLRKKAQNVRSSVSSERQISSVKTSVAKTSSNSFSSPRKKVSLDADLERSFTESEKLFKK